MSAADAIADALVEYINGLDLSRGVSAAKPKQASDVEAESHELTVYVIPVEGGGREKRGKRAIRRRPAVNLYITYQLKQAETREELSQFVDELLDEIELVAMAGYTWLDIDELTFYDRDALKQGRFSSLHRSIYVEEYCKHA